MASENETVADIVAGLRRQSNEEHAFATKLRSGDCDDVDFGRTCCYDEDAKYLSQIADRIEAAAKREREEIVDAVSVLLDGMCLHCDMQQQCAEGEDGMSTTCNAMAIVNNFINRYKKLEVSDERPF